MSTALPAFLAKSRGKRITRGAREIFGAECDHDRRGRGNVIDSKISDGADEKEGNDKIYYFCSLEGWRANRRLEEECVKNN